jgi:hypothetical protein
VDYVRIGMYKSSNSNKTRNKKQDETGRCSFFFFFMAKDQS